MHVFDVLCRFLVLFSVVEGLLAEVVDLSHETPQLLVFLHLEFLGIYLFLEGGELLVNRGHLALVRYQEILL